MKYKGYDANMSSGRSPNLEANQRPVPKPSLKSVLKGKSRTSGPYQHDCDCGEKIGYGEYRRSGN